MQRKSATAGMRFGPVFTGLRKHLWGGLQPARGFSPAEDFYNSGGRTEVRRRLKPALLPGRELFLRLGVEAQSRNTAHPREARGRPAKQIYCKQNRSVVNSQL